MKKIFQNKWFIISLIIIGIILVSILIILWTRSRFKSTLQKTQMPSISIPRIYQPQSTDLTDEIPSDLWLPSHLENLPAGLEQEEPTRETYKEESLSPEEKLQLALPVITKNFSIEYDDRTNRYAVTIFTDYRNIDQVGSIEDQIRRGKKEVEEWFRHLGVDPTTLQIDFFESGL